MSMERANTEHRIVEHFRTAVTREKVPDEALLDTPLRNLIDSIEMIRFLTYLETTFEITIHDDEVTPESFDTLRSSIVFVHEKLRKRS